jgi:DNA-binding protein
VVRVKVMAKVMAKAEGFHQVVVKARGLEWRVVSQAHHEE